MGHGGGTITWKFKSALLFAVVAAVIFLPSVEGLQIQNTLNKDQKTNLNQLDVNAAYKVTKSSVAAYNVVVTPKYVMATGKNTCSIPSDYKYHTRVFENYDPSSHKWGVLAYEVGSGRNNPEGMWYSKVTDMDFCLVHGKSHDNRGKYLTPYNGTINGKKVVNGYFV